MVESNILPSGQTRIDIMEMRGIVKRFPGVLANDQVNFDVRSGEIHALLGENGAGKSTLMKILYGLYQPDGGEIRLNGKPVTIHSPSDSIGLGIGMIHQHFMLVPTLTVAENVALGLPSSRGIITDLERVSRRIRDLAQVYGLHVDPDDFVWQLSVGQQQRVEIIKALYRGAALLILDEPTAVLTPQEVDEFFVTLKQMAVEGHALIFISHKLHEVLHISNLITVLRDGRVVGTVATRDATKGSLAQMMVGRPVSLRPDRSDVQIGQPRLKLENVWSLSDRETPALRGVSLDVCAGEIVGVAGVSGNGQKELAEVISGLRQPSRGNIYIDDLDIAGSGPGQIMERGVAYIPEERMREAMIGEFNVAENVILREHNRMPFSRAGFLNPRAISKHTSNLVEEFNVKTPSQDTLVKSLSGGNIQKLVLARELSRKPSVLVAAQPTRGLDIGATEYVHYRLLEQRREGTATLLISEDLDEILALSDRIAVIYEGEIMGVVNHIDASAEKLGLLMAGVRTDEISPAGG